MRRAKLLVLDTETGGLDPLVHSLLTIGLVVWEDGKITASDEFSVCEPEIVTERDALLVNRVDPRSVHASGLDPKDAIERLERFILAHFSETDEVVLSGHNVSFDVQFLRRLYRIARRPFWARY